MNKEKFFNIINENIEEIKLFNSKQISVSNTITTSLIYDGFVMYKIFFNRYKEKMNSNNREITHKDILNGILKFPDNLYPKKVFEELEGLNFINFIEIFSELFKYNKVNINIDHLFIHNTNLYTNTILVSNSLKDQIYTFINEKVNEIDLLNHIETLFPYFNDNSISPNLIISNVVINDKNNEAIFVDSMASLFVQLLKSGFKKIATTKFGYAEKKFLGMLFKSEIIFMDLDEGAIIPETFSDVIIDNMFLSTSDSIQFEKSSMFIDNPKSKISPIFEEYSKFKEINGDDTKGVLLLNNVSLNPQILEGKNTLKEIVDNNYLEAIIQLPIGLVKHPMSIWILNRNKKTSKTILVLESYFKKTRFQLRRDGLTQDDIERIKKIISSFRMKGIVSSDDKSIITTCKNDIVKKKYILLPSLYTICNDDKVEEEETTNFVEYIDSYLEIMDDNDTIMLENEVVEMIKDLKKMNLK